MSTLSPSNRSDGDTIRRATELVRAPAETFAFWAAVLLPFCYIPLLYVGLGGVNERVAFAVLLACNVVALLLGHDHHRDPQ